MMTISHSVWGFKEWVLVTEALGRGAQTILLRKGGIAEGKEGFAFRHAQFILFPTWYHGQWEKVQFTPQHSIPTEAPQKLQLSYWAELQEELFLADYAQLEGLSSLHCLEESLLRERWYYDKKEKKGKGIHAALVRIYRLEKPLEITMEKRFQGCRSWIQLPREKAIFTKCFPVLSEQEFQKKVAIWQKVLG